MSYFVYIIRSQTTSRYYCGQTENLEERLFRHNSGRSKYTKHGLPWVQVVSFCFATRAEAMKVESQIKKRGILRYLQDKSLLDG